jgi:hypothetical protein
LRARVSGDFRDLRRSGFHGICRLPEQFGMLKSSCLVGTHDAK